MIETKKEFRAREKAWLAALPGCPSNQQARILRMLNEERLAHGLKAIHQ